MSITKVAAIGTHIIECLAVWVVQFVLWLRSYGSVMAVGVFVHIVIVVNLLKAGLVSRDLLKTEMF